MTYGAVDLQFALMRLPYRGALMAADPRPAKPVSDDSLFFHCVNTLSTLTAQYPDPGSVGA